MRHAIFSILISTCVVSVGHSAISAAPSNWHSDDIVTLIYDPFLGNFFVDNPAGNDFAADAIATFELTSSEPFFTGPRPPQFNGQFDVWSLTRARRLDPTGFFDMEWPAGSVATGVSHATEILTLSGSFLSGGALEPADFFYGGPEPDSLTLCHIGAIVLLSGRRRRF